MWKESDIRIKVKLQVHSHTGFIQHETNTDKRKTIRKENVRIPT